MVKDFVSKADNVAANSSSEVNANRHLDLGERMRTIGSYLPEKTQMLNADRCLGVEKWKRTIGDYLPERTRMLSGNETKNAGLVSKLNVFSVSNCLPEGKQVLKTGTTKKMGLVNKLTAFSVVNYLSDRRQTLNRSTTKSLKAVSKLTAFLVFFALFFGKGVPLTAQIHIDYSNSVLTTDCCPEFKKRVDSIINNTPIVFEGQRIKQVHGLHYDYYLFEIGKVYRGSERLQSGTVEIIVKSPDVGLGYNESPSFGAGWHIIFAKETDMPNVFDANNSTKLEVFYHNKPVTSYFAEVSGWSIPRETDLYAGFGFSINFDTKEEVRTFLSTYGLSPKDVPKADTLKSLTHREVEAAKQRAIEDAEYRLWQEESGKRAYKSVLENLWKLDSASGKNSTRKKEVEDAMQEYENASDSVRNQLHYNRTIEQKHLLDSISNAKKSTGQGQQKRGNANLTLSINNTRVTTSSGNSFLEFDVMVRADQANTYMYMMCLTIQYESDASEIPFKKNIHSLSPPELWIIPGALFTGNFYASDPSIVNNRAIAMVYQAQDGNTLSAVPLTDVFFARIKMKMNNNNVDYTTLTILDINDANYFYGTHAFYNTSSTGDLSTSIQYTINYSPAKIVTIPIAPSPVIANYYINTPGNTSGSAGCGDILVIQGQHFGTKNIKDTNDISTYLAFKLGAFNTSNPSTIPHYKVRDNGDYTLWTDTEIRIKLPSRAERRDSAFLVYDGMDQYVGTGTFKVINNYGKEATSASDITINHVVSNWSYRDTVWKKIPILIPKKDCINGYRFQVCSTMAGDAQALNCIKKAMRDWSNVLGIELSLDLDGSGNPKINPNPWLDDGIHTISYTCTTHLNQPFSLMNTRSHNTKPCEQYLPIRFLNYYRDHDIGICNTAPWNKDTVAIPSSSQYSFYSAILHELGHVLGLRHVASTTDLMKPQLATGVRTNLTEGALVGGTKIINLSSDHTINWRVGNCANDILEELNSEDRWCSNILPITPGIWCSNLSPTEIIVEWSNVPNATNYHLEYALDADFTTIIDSFNLSYYTTTRTFSGLVPGRVYYFRINAQNLLGTSPYSKTNNVAHPFIPQNLRCTSTISTITVEWSGVVNAANYVLEYSLSPNFSTIISSYTLSYWETTRTFSSLNQGVSYYFRVKAVNENGTSGYSSTSSCRVCDINSFVSISASSVALATNTTWSANNHLLTVPVYVAPGVTLTITGNVFCSSDAEIIVMQGGKLVVNGGVLTTTCDEWLWRGIEVWGNPDLFQNATNQGFVELKNGAVISNAIYGVHVGEKVCPAQNGGGILRADNAYFVNNQQAVYFAPFSNYENNSLKNNASYFKNSMFMVDDGLLLELAQVEMHGVRGILFENCEFTHKYGYANGIYANNSSVRIGNTPSSGGGCTFSGFGKAVYIKNSSVHSSTIYQSDFQKNTIGIALEDAQHTTIQSCNFYRNSKGIYLKNSSLYNIENNYLAAEYYHSGKGIVIENSGTTNHFIKNNSFNNLCAGCLAIGNNSNGRTEQQSEGVVFMCNKYNNNQAIEVAYNSHIRHLQSGKYTVSATGNMFITQGMARHAIDNRGSVYFNYQYLSPDPTGFHSPYYYYHITPQYHLVETNRDDCTFHGYAGDDYYSVGEKEDTDILDDNYQILKSAYNDNLIACSTYTFPIDWESPEVVEIVSQLTGTVLITGELIITINGDEPSSDLEEQIVLYYQQTHLKQEMDAICYAALDILVNHAEEDSLNMEEYRKWVGRFNTIEADYLLAESYLSLGEFDQAAEILEEMSTKFPELDEESHQNYWDYFAVVQEYSALATGDNFPLHLFDELVRLLNNNDFVAVRAYSLGEIAICDWAEMYPRDFAVHSACDCNFDDDFDDSRGGGHGKGKSRKNMGEDTFEEKMDNGIKIHPNPTNGELRVTSYGLRIESVEVFDIVGSNVGAYRIRPTENETVINISHLVSGMYFLKIKTEDGRTIMKKVVKD